MSSIREKILIVEDEEKLARFVELELKHEGYEVEAAHDGRTGLEKAESWKPDLLILDLMLPELSGIEVCRRLRLAVDVLYDAYSRASSSLHTSSVTDVLSSAARALTNIDTVL